MGDFQEMGLGLGWWPSDLMLRLLEFSHVSTGLPWWLSIAFLTVILRITMFPISLATTRNLAVAAHINEEQKLAIVNIKAATDDMARKKEAEKLGQLYKKWGYSPFSNFIGLLQIPIFFAMFRTCNICSNLPVPGFQEGGAYWFTDLTAIDPYFILPTISGLTTAATIIVRLQLQITNT
jgi:YidC/Oxa1 family membrane protein insertase